MKKKILVFQFRTDPSLIHERLCLLKVGQFSNQEVDFINVLDPQNYPLESINVNFYCGVILGGSGEVSISNWSPEHQKLILAVEPLLQKIISQQIPILGICFGHQLIAHILGGKVDNDPNQSESGTFRICLNDKGLESPIFENLPQSFMAVEGHHNSVIKLPSIAQVLASSHRCGIEAYQVGNYLFGVQFHPELDKKGMHFRLNLFPNYHQEKDVNQILNDYRPTPFAKKVFKNFQAIIRDKIREGFQD